MAGSARTSEPAATGPGRLHRYVIALGANRWHPRHGSPRRTLAAAVQALVRDGLTIEAVSPWLASVPLGPSRRTYANGAMRVASPLAPAALLARLQQVETAFGRRRRGQAWSARVLDLDIVLWSGGCWTDRHLVIPHRHFRDRAFVLTPARAVAADWRDPVTGLTLRHLHARLTAPRALPKRGVLRRLRPGP
ncbi:2-amino-4-hydroxy-6-hydroxymethyldihydropteridine diphosphokinase [Novosphingobium piscinae]|uniref:2-amino-4-hydroxy-6-hydroxymethyldihydropteridine pyrophosphokinase n=1 Tax=Novosphingobium piscinae TaxID=1507448 RepID=A0A7X1FWR7_9SPHN|nr:2-amino-4-hydroxy-6-hydroxymethyldihydropteridine diphosphokinase [Novosphingobium piscinae]MBC2668438.1 2-amino-4-hydroxy-6-hydroxymethyldihydropteridine diphosphokinase [Novosphingobium piscinae]